LSAPFDPEMNCAVTVTRQCAVVQNKKNKKPSCRYDSRRYCLTAE